MDECVMGTWKDGIYSGEIGRGENKAEGLYPVGRGGIGEWKMVRSRKGGRETFEVLSMIHSSSLYL